VIEVLILGTGLLVPLMYAVISIMSVQSATYAATSAAREAARAYVTGTTPADGAARARTATRLVLADAGVTSTGPRVRCVGGCLVPGSRVEVSVSVEVSLPLVPGGPTITVTGHESMPVDRYRGTP
jgi:Flp pilus assembly protein TadG